MRETAPARQPLISFLVSASAPANRRGLVTWLRLAVLATAYVVGFFLTEPVVGRIYTVAVMIPILLSALYFGTRGSVLVSLVAVGMTGIILSIPEGVAVWTAAHVAMPVASVAFGIATGLLRDVAIRGRESRKLLQTAFEAAQDGLWDYDIPTQTPYFSPRWFEMLGYQPDAFPHTFDTFANLIHPDDRQEALAQITEAAELGKRQFNITFRMRADDGSYIWILSRGKNVAFDSDGRGTRMVGVHADVSTLKKAESDLIYLAYHDQLTGLLNRKAFYERAEQTLDQVGRNGNDGQCAFLMLDMDNFKDVNDSYGHDFGDELLSAVGERLREHLRKSDLLFRLGGDEFTILLTRITRPTDAALVASNLVRAFADPFTIREHTIYTAISLGIAVYPRDGDGVAELMRKADTALYDSKQERNTYRFYTMKMQTEALAKMELINSLRRAIDDEQFRLYYQPIMRADGTLAGAEALLRWEDPNRGLRLPHEFLATAEESGAILRIGRWVLLQAGLDADHWRTLGLPNLKVSVNLSPKQLLSRSITDDVELALAASGLDPSLLELELTESSFIAPTETSTGILRSFQERGISISIDDFGTGYSSLSYLKHLPANTLKIDRSFVIGLPGVGEDVSIVRAVVTMAHGLGLNVVAEGVDDAAQVAFLNELGCDYFQGYYFSKPMPEEHFVQFARAQLRAEPARGAEREKERPDKQQLQYSWNQKRHTDAQMLGNEPDEPLEQRGAG